MTDLAQPKTRREHEIWQACDDLWALHASMGKVTGDAIREQLMALGFKKGSPNEIYKYRRSWKTSRGIADDIDDNIDTTQSDPISRAVSLVYEQIHGQAQTELEQLRARYDGQLVEMADELQGLRNEHQQLVEQHRTLAKEFALGEQENERLQGALAAEQKQLAILLERHQANERMLEQYKSDSNTLLIELKSVHEKEVDVWRDQMTQLHTLFKNQWHDFSEETSRFRLELRQVGEQKEKAEKSLAQEKQECDLLRQELSIANRELFKARSEAKQHAKRLQNLETKFATTRTELLLANKQKNEYRTDAQKMTKTLARIANSTRPPQTTPGLGESTGN